MCEGKGVTSVEWRPFCVFGYDQLFLIFPGKKPDSGGVNTKEAQFVPNHAELYTMLNALEGLFASSRRKRRGASSVAIQHLEARLALTATALAPATDTLPQEVILSEDVVVTEDGEHTYPADDGIEYPEEFVAAEVAIAADVDVVDAAEPAVEIQFADTNVIPENTIFDQVPVPSQLDGAFAQVQEQDQAIDRLELEDSGPLLVPFSDSLSDEIPDIDPESDDLDEEEQQEEQPEDENMSSMDDDADSEEKSDGTLMADEDGAEGDVMPGMGEADSPAVSTSASDLQNSETAAKVEAETVSAATGDEAESEELSSMEVSALDEFFSSEQGTVAPNEKVAASVAIGLLAATQLRRNRRNTRYENQL